MGSAVQDGFYRVWMSDSPSATNEELDVGKKMHLCYVSWGSTWKLLGILGEELKKKLIKCLN